MAFNRDGVHESFAGEAQRHARAFAHTQHAEYLDVLHGDETVEDSRRELESARTS